MICEIECTHFKDFFKTLKKGCVDLILTDPPYTISKQTGFKSVKKGVERFAVSMDFGAWDHVEVDLKLLTKLSFQSLKESGTCIIFYDLWKISHLSQAMKLAGFKMIRLLIWEKTNPVPLNMSSTYLSNSREVAVVGVKKGKPTFNSSYDRGVYQYPIPRHRGKKTHPTQKPLELFCELIKKHSRKGEMVVDPFLGSGTTAEACLRTSRAFKGCDRDKKYCKLSKKRVLDFLQEKEGLSLT